MTEVDNNKNALSFNQSPTYQAKLSKNQKFIIDSDENRVEFNDPRVVVVDPAAKNPYGKQLIKQLYKTRNRKIRIADEVTPTILQDARKICSGSECLPCLSISGAILKDLQENRNDNEITLIRNPADQAGPCANGAWPLTFRVFAERLDMRNVIFAVAPNFYNNFFGFSLWDFRLEHLLHVVSQYIIEARNALSCAAMDKISALEQFEEITQRFIEKVRDDSTLENALAEWAEEVKNIPLQKSLAKIPKVLIIGGLNLLFCHYPVEEYFLEHGIIPKVVDVGESVEWFASEYAVRYGFKRGIMDPIDQINPRKIIFSVLKNNPADVIIALGSSLAVSYLNWKMHSYRKIMSKSGLLFDSFPSFKDGSESAFKYVSHNGFTETSITTSRFLHAIKSNVYDGVVNLGCYNCSPAMNSQSILRPIANKSTIPYAAIDVEGPIISANQKRVLETISFQVKRRKEKKNKD